MKNPRMYVLVWNKLSKSQQAVQAGHAVAQYLVQNPLSQWKNQTLVYLKVSEKQLHNYFDELQGDAVLPDSCVGFFEPDIGNKLTAVSYVTEDT